MVFFGAAPYRWPCSSSCSMDRQSVCGHPELSFTHVVQHCVFWRGVISASIDVTPVSGTHMLLLQKQVPSL